MTFARRHEPGQAERLLDEITAAAASTADWHAWLWRMRLAQASAELALARDAFDESVSAATSAIEQSRARRRPKYETLGLIARARASNALGRTRDAIADAKTAMRVADTMSDPVLHLIALDALIQLDGTDELAAQACAVIDIIDGALPDELMRRCFVESEVVRRLRASR